MSYVKLKKRPGAGSVLDHLRLAYADGSVDRLPDADCGGRRKCGKCKVMIRGDISPVSDEEKALLTEDEISRGVRLACMAVPEGDFEVSIPSSSNNEIVSIKNGGDEIFVPLGEDENCAVAADIGTTSVAVYILSGTTGRIAGMTAIENPQRAYGADVLSRIQNIRDDPSLLGHMRDILFGGIAEALAGAGVTKERISSAVITANTIMEHIAAGLDPCGMAELPFRPESLFGTDLPTPLGGNTYFAPCFAAYVGGDIATGYCACVPPGEKRTVFFLDIGTNGEMALLHKGKLTVCAAAAGPAFEGAEIECGCVGKPGAIDRARMEPDGSIVFSTINDSPACGICGSGLISIGAALLDAELIDEAGNLENGDKYELTDGIYISQNDIRKLQLAKAAICAGIYTLLDKSGICPDDVDTVYLAGSFGARIDCRDACRIGLMPEKFEDKTVVAGNAAGLGAVNILKDEGFRRYVEDTVAGGEYLDLSSCPGFNDHFIMCMGF